MKFARYALVICLSLPIISFAQTAPPFSKGTDYPTYKKTLLKDGWTPVKQTKDCGFNCQGQRSDGFIETLDCGDAGTAPCTFVLKGKDGNLIKVHTVGENLGVTKVVGSEPSSAQPASTTTANSAPTEKLSLKPSNKPTSDPIGALKNKLDQNGWAMCSAVFLDVQANYLRNPNVSGHNQRELNRMMDILIKVKQRMLASIPPSTQPYFVESLNHSVATYSQILRNSSISKRKSDFDYCVGAINSVIPPN